MLLVVSIAMLAYASAEGQVKLPRTYLRTETQARTIVRKALHASPIIDGHNDLFAWYFGCEYKKLLKCPQTVEDYPLDTITKGQTDIPRWRKGGVGGVQLNVFGTDAFSIQAQSDLLRRIEKT